MKYNFRQQTKLPPSPPMSASDRKKVGGRRYVVLGSAINQLLTKLKTT